MAGTASHKVKVGVYDIATGKTIYLQAGDPTDRYFSNIAWSPCGGYLYMMEHPREQNRAELVRYHALTGAKDAVLITEEHEKYVEPQHPIAFLPWDDTKFIYHSQKDGFNHLYLYNIEGQELAQLTKGEWLVQELVGFHKKRKEVILVTTEVSPLQSNLYAVSVKDGKRRVLGNSEGVHSVELSASADWMIDRYSAPQTPRRIELVSVKDGKTKNILLDAPNPWKGFDAPEITVGTLKAADGVTDLYYRLVKPVGFDPTKKYPAVIYVYGGPHAQMIQNSWNYAVRGWDIYMAQKGYVVFTVDNRGSSNRGLVFENCTFRQLGVEEMKDQLRGVEFLKSQPYVDADRLGVHGWSFGGFMTSNLMLTYPDVFKVGVAGGPVTDWKYYEVMYGERYMDTPQSNPEGYKNSSLLEKAGNLKGRLLVIHGGNDPVCVPQMTYSFMKACIDKGTHPDLFIYPGHGHNMTGRDRVHLHEHITRYFEDFLK
jgi:dipeptidyl-peptidase-4